MEAKCKVCWDVPYYYIHSLWSTVHKTTNFHYISADTFFFVFLLQLWTSSYMVLLTDRSSASSTWRCPISTVSSISHLLVLLFPSSVLTCRSLMSSLQPHLIPFISPLSCVAGTSESVSCSTESWKKRQLLSDQLLLRFPQDLQGWPRRWTQTEPSLEFCRNQYIL